MKLIKHFLIFSFIQLIVVSVVSAGSISGKVLIGDANGKPAKNINVVAFDTSSTQVPVLAYIGVTDDEGKYLIKDLPKATYKVIADFSGYTGCTNLINVAENQIIENVDIILKKITGTFSNFVEGKVTDNKTGDAVEMAHIILVPNGQLPYYIDAFTDKNGKYLIAQIPEGKYNLVVEKEYGYERFKHPETFTIKDTTKISDLNISLVKAIPNASLAGTVKNKTTGEVIKNAEVTINYISDHGFSFGDTAHKSIIYKVKTDENGAYKFDTLYTGDFWLTCSAENFKEIQQHVKIENSTNLDITLVPFISGTIAGNVYFDNTGNPTKNAWIKFSPVDPNSNASYGFTVTDKQGNYSIKAPVGKYYVSCSYILDQNKSNFYYNEFFNDVHNITDAEIITVVENKDVKNINFGLPSPKNINVVIKGKVTDDKGSPVSDALVNFYMQKSANCIDTDYGNFQPLVATTNSDGKFEVKFKRTILSAIEFKVSAEKNGYEIEFYNGKKDWLSADGITINNDTTINDLNFSLKEFVKTGNEISGTITDMKGIALENIFVFGQSSSCLTNPNPTKMDFPFAITDKDGKYKLDNLKPEEYVISFSGNEYISEIYNDVFTWEKATKVKAKGIIIGIDASLEKYPTIFSNTVKTKTVAGRIFDNNQNPINGAIITLQDNKGQAIGTSLSSKDGLYSISTKGIGSVIIISKLGYESTRKSIKNSSVVNITLNQSVVGIETKDKENLPDKISLGQNYPNPFNPTTQINFNLPSIQKVQLDVFNIIGEKVATLINRTMGVGKHTYTFNASKLNSGLYLYKLTAGNFVEVKKMILIK